MNRPKTTEETPAMTSDRKRMTDARRRRCPYSLRYTAASTPSGTAIAVAAPVVTRVPSTAGPIPGPRSRELIGMSEVRKLQLTMPAPFRTR